MEEQRAGEQLEGQEPSHPSEAEIADWIAMYEKLISFTDDVLQRTRQFLAELHGPPRDHVENTNIRIMEEELVSFHERLDAWRQRAGEDIGSHEVSD